MNVTEAIESRISCRAFGPQPVSASIIREILEKARRAPSGGNLQPWHVQVLTGSVLSEFLQMIAARSTGNAFGEGTEYNIYPPQLSEPYRSRRFKCGEDMYSLLGIPRADKQSRLQQFAGNYRLFGAPVGLFFFIDRQMDRDQWADLGMFMQNIMLLAREHGLDTCAQEAWALWHKTIMEFLSVPPQLMLFCGMALGCKDEAAPVNRLRTERAPLEEFATLRGFDSVTA
jgi:nitroreductase